MSNLELSARQKQIIATGLTTLAAGIVVVAVVVVLVYFARFFRAFEHVFLPLAVAAVLAMVIDPWYAWLRLRARMPVPLALMVVFLSLLIPLAGIVVFFGAMLNNQWSELVERLPEWWAWIQRWVQQNQARFAPMYSVDSFDSLDSPMLSIAQYAMAKLASAGSSVVAATVTLLGWIIVPVYLVFFLLMPRLRPQALTPENLPFLRPATAADALFLIREFFHLVVVFFRGQIVIAWLQGAMFALGFSAIGLRYGAILGLIFGFFNIVPFLGSMLGLGICLPLAWLQGGAPLLATVFAIFCVVQLFESYYLTPKIMGDATGLNPLLIIIGVFFWGTALNGILGMILAIPLTAFFVVLWRLARDKYIGQLF